MGHTFTLAQSFAVDHWVFTEITQSSALSVSHRNMPRLVSEPALLKTWPAPVASTSPALWHAKTFRSPDLAQDPCLPKALIPISLVSKHLATSYCPRTPLAGSGWRTETRKDFSEAPWEACGSGKLEHPSPTHSHLLSLLKHLSAPFPQGGDNAPVSGAAALSHQL